MATPTDMTEPMTDAAPPVALEALPAKWRAKSVDLRLMHLYPQAELCDMHADELEAALAAEPRQQEPTEESLKVLVDSVLRASGFDPLVMSNSELYADFHTTAVRAYRLGQLHSEPVEATEPRPPQLTTADIITIREGLRALDCGDLHCRYCSAGMPNWDHSRSCPYADSERVVERAHQILDRVQAAEPRPPAAAVDRSAALAAPREDQ